MSINQFENSSIHHSVYKLKGKDLTDWITILSKENIFRMSNAFNEKDNFLARKRTIIENVINICNEFDLPVECCFLSVELFAKFICKHITDYHTIIMDTAKKDSTNDSKIEAKKTWFETLERMKSQTALRMLTCIQISSKMTSNYKSLNIDKIQSFLNKFNIKYENNAICQSELRVMKTLDYKVAITTPLVYIDSLLCSLAHANLVPDLKVLREMCLDLLVLVYMFWQSIYTNFISSSKPKSQSDSDTSLTIAAIQNDYFLLSVSVIAASVYMCKSNNTAEVISHLAQLTLVWEQDIIDLSAIIIKHIDD